MKFQLRKVFGRYLGYPMDAEAVAITTLAKSTALTPSQLKTLRDALQLYVEIESDDPEALNELRT